VVGDVLRPYVERTVDAGDAARVQSVCAFLERMATSPDEGVVNALAVSLLEVLGDHRDRLEPARQSMSPAMLALSREVERFWGRETWDLAATLRVRRDVGWSLGAITRHRRRDYLQWRQLDAAVGSS
jgi:hypothetical protein